LCLSLSGRNNVYCVNNPMEYHNGNCCTNKTWLNRVPGFYSSSQKSSFSQSCFFLSYPSYKNPEEGLPGHICFSNKVSLIPYFYRVLPKSFIPQKSIFL